MQNCGITLRQLLEYADFTDLGRLCGPASEYEASSRVVRGEIKGTSYERLREELE
jgi:hypothetical protein